MYGDPRHQHAPGGGATQGKHETDALVNALAPLELRTSPTKMSRGNLSCMWITRSHRPCAYCA